MLISGIQQIGIGIPHVYEAWDWYNRFFGTNVQIFDEAAEAGLMLPYTGGMPQKRHAVLALNMQGGSGFEIWQYTSRTPQAPNFQIQLGDLGIFACKIKSKDIASSYNDYKKNKLLVCNEIQVDTNNNKHFFVKDPWGNHFNVVKSSIWYTKGKQHTGSVYGAIIGVSDVDASIRFYKDILGYDEVLVDQVGVFDDFAHLAGGKRQFRRVLLTHKNPRLGSFSKLFGNSFIELVQAIDRKPKKIYENRMWGDLGFIHLCFDIHGMEELKAKSEAFGTPFTVDSSGQHKNGFDMGEAAGHFSYIEDPDGTLIEFVETHKIPIFKKLGIYLNLKDKDRTKPLPDYIIKALKWNKKPVSKQFTV